MSHTTILLPSLAWPDRLLKKNKRSGHARLTIRSGYFAGHRLRYKNLFCRSLISSCWTLGLGLGFGLGYIDV